MGTVTNWTIEWLLLDPKAVIQLEIKGTAQAKAFGLLTFYPKQDVIVWCVPLPSGPDNGISMKCTPDKPTQTSNAERGKALPDCSATKCPSICQCAEKQCAKELSACLDDATCSGGQDCADKCACGDHGCLAKCAVQHPSSLALPLLKCAEQKCHADVIEGEVRNNNLNRRVV